MKKLLLVLILCYPLHNLSAQETEDEDDILPTTYHAFGVFYDQDYTLEMLGLGRLNEDRNYTMGLGIYYSAPGLQRGLLFKPHGWLNRIFGKSYLNQRNSIAAIMLGNGSFTPDSLSADYVISNDRPYGSLTYFQTIRSYVDNTAFRTYTSTFSVGLIGTYISREVQTAIHKTMNDNDTKNPRTPRGWHHQVSTDGEATAAFSFKSERLITKKHISEEARTSVTAIELKDAWQYSLGYYTSINYEFNLRAGKIDPRHWTYMVNPLSQSNKSKFSDSTMQEVLRSQASPIDYYEQPGSFELYLFSSIRPTFILYNALLNGQFRQSAHTIDFQDMKHLVLEIDAGVASSIPAGKNKLIELKLKISGRSPEFELTGRPPRWHYWGGLELVFSGK